MLRSRWEGGTGACACRSPRVFERVCGACDQWCASAEARAQPRAIDDDAQRCTRQTSRVRTRQDKIWLPTYSSNRCERTDGDQTEQTRTRTRRTRAVRAHTDHTLRQHRHAPAAVCMDTSSVEYDVAAHIRVLNNIK